MRDLQIYGHRTFYGRMRSLGPVVLEHLLLSKQGWKTQTFPTDGPISPAVRTHFERKNKREIAAEHDDMQMRVGLPGKLQSVIGGKQGQWWHEALLEIDKLSPPDPFQDPDGWRSFATAQAFKLTMRASTLLLKAAFGSDATGNRDEIEALIRSLAPDVIEKTFGRFDKRNEHFGVWSLHLEDHDHYMIKDDVAMIKGYFPDSYAASIVGKPLSSVIHSDVIAHSGVKIVRARQTSDKILLIETDICDEHNTVSWVHDPKGIMPPA